MKYIKSFKVFEAVIDPLDYSEFIENFKNQEFNNFDELNSYSEKFGVEFCDFDTFYNTLGTDVEKELAPKDLELFGGVKFALFNKYREPSGKIMVVVIPEKFFDFLRSDKVDYLLHFLREIFRHESIHLQQVGRMEKDVYKLDASPTHNTEKYWKNKQELMAYANTLLDHLKDQGLSKEEIKDRITRQDFKSWVWKVYSQVLKDDRENMNRFMKYLYEYWEKM